MYEIRLSGSLALAPNMMGQQVDPNKGEGFGANVVLSFRARIANGKAPRPSSSPSTTADPTL